MDECYPLMELNILDGSATTQSSVTLAGADGIIISDALIVII